MTKLLPALFLVFLCAQLTAQVTLNNDYFPVVGDTLKTEIADSTYVQTIDQLMPGTDLAWDFGIPVSAGADDQPVEVPEAGAPYATATMVIQTGNNTRSFYSASETEFSLVGVTASLELLPNFPISTEVSPSRPTRRAPLNYQDQFSTNTERSVTISPDSIPEEALGLVGDALDNVDSIRITTINTRTDLVDAYGTLTIDGKTWDVLRETRNESIFIRVEFLTGVLGFVDVTGQIESLIPAVAPFVGQQPITVTSYYWSPGVKEPIAVVEVDEETGMKTSMTYKRKQAIVSTGGPGLQQARIRVFPNPAINLATFEIEGLERGTYELTLNNILGGRMEQRSFSPIGNQTRISLDVSRLPAGIYLYNLRNERGRTITTRKLQVK